MSSSIVLAAGGGGDDNGVRPAALASLRAEIWSKLRDCLKMSHLAAEPVPDSTRFFAAGLGLDSVDALEIMVMIQREYDLRIEESERETALADFGSLVRFVSVNRGRNA